MKILKNITWILLIPIFLTGCFIEEIEMDLNQGENVRLSIEAWITDFDEVQTIKLNTTTDYFDEFKETAVMDASVVLSYENESITFTHTENGLYKAPDNWRAISEKMYTLEIDYDGTTYSATSFMDAMPALENTVARPFAMENDTVFYEVYFSFQEKQGEGHGYFAVDYYKEEADWQLTSGGYTNDQFYDGEYFEDISVTNDFYLVGDIVLLEAYSIGIEASNFLQDVSSEVFREGLFDPPPVNIRSNFSNEAVGYFIASGAKRMEIVVE